MKTTKYTYNGKKKTPKVEEVKVDGKKLPADCYKVSYSKNINAGNAVVTVTGKGNYKGSTVKYFTNQKASAKITLKKWLPQSHWL